MRFTIRRLPVLGLVLTLGCMTDSTGLDEALEPAPGIQLGSERSSLTVMTRNLYIGANVDAVIAALASSDPSDDFPALRAAIAVIGETDFPSRAKALADEIARARPHVIGLQEVTQLDIDLTGFGLPIVLHQDFMVTLLAELASRGLNYSLTAMNTNTRAAPLPGLSLVDHDALIIDASRVSAANLVEQNFSLNIGVVAPGVEIKRGWVAADVTLDGVSYRVVNTHLESGDTGGLDQLRAAQALELVTMLGTSPAVLLGDFNDVPGSIMHQVIGGAGFTDAWAAVHPTETGFTCCHLANLANERPRFDQRIDYVLIRGIGGVTGGVRSISRTGWNRSAIVRGPAHTLWPSDHAGLVARLRLPVVFSSDALTVTLQE
jgi:endonuclease/exonuclease/phosphatase family metal-dependent hydrolase